MKVASLGCSGEYGTDSGLFAVHCLFLFPSPVSLVCTRYAFWFPSPVGSPAKESTPKRVKRGDRVARDAIFSLSPLDR